MLCWHELDGRRDIGGLATVLAVLAMIVVVVFIVIQVLWPTTGA